jgi:hypothetical protein
MSEEVFALRLKPQLLIPGHQILPAVQGQASASHVMLLPEVLHEPGADPLTSMLRGHREVAEVVLTRLELTGSS